MSECPAHRHQAYTWKTTLSSLQYLPFVLTLAWSRAGIVDSFSLAWTHFQGNVSPLRLLLHFLLLFQKLTSVIIFFSVQDKWRERAALCDVCGCCGRWPRRVSWVRVKSFVKERGRGGQCGYRIKLSSLCHYVFLPALFLKCPETKRLLCVSCNCSYLLCFVRLVPKPHFFSMGLSWKPYKGERRLRCV